MKLWQKSDKFWLFFSLVSFAVLYLNLIWKTTADIDRLTTESLFWIAILWLLWRRRDKLNLQSNLFSTCFGLALICLVLAKSFSLFWFESILIPLIPIFLSFGLALIASGFKGLRQYWRELFFTWFLFFPEGVIGTVIDKFFRITVINAKLASFVLHYVGFNVSSYSNHVVLDIPELGKFTALVDYPCAGIPMIVLMLRISLLLVAFFPLPKKEQILVPLVSLGIGFGLGVIRVCILTLLISEKAKFDYWHGTGGSQIFSTLAIVIFSFFCHSVVKKYDLFDSVQKSEAVKVAEVQNSGVQ